MSLTTADNINYLLEKKREEAVARDESVIEEEKSDDNNDRGTGGKGVQRKATRKKDGSSCGGQGQFQREQRLEC